MKGKISLNKNGLRPSNRNMMFSFLLLVTGQDMEFWLGVGCPSLCSDVI